MTDLSRHHHHHHQGNGFGSGSSIHDYPEHLNPFYEDENHKRLRFLEHKPAPKSQRRGSLSSLRDGLRELWQFSSIRFGKKRSSTLGINKTSESPPPLRRDTYEVDSFASTSGYRNTVNAPGYGTTRESQSYTTTPLFVRQTRYRSSMQDRQDNGGEIGFMRNDRYRSTIQNGFATYNTGMVTSTPRKKQAPPTPYGTTSRAGQQQYNNINPFDADLEPEGDTLSTVSVDSSYSSTLRSRTSGTRTRTKRRAPPPPPVAITPANRVVPSPEESSVVDEAQNEDLRNLTAEIESFVRISSSNVDTSTKDTSTLRTDAIVETREIKPHDLNNNSAQSEIPTTVSTIECEIVQNSRTVQGTEHESSQIQKETNMELQTVPKEEKSDEVLIESPKPTEVHTSTSISVDTAVSGSIETSPKPSPRKKADKTQTEITVDAVTTNPQPDVDFENLALPETPVPTRRSNRENREKYITQDVTTIHKTSYEKPTVAPKAALPSTTEEGDDDEGPTTTIIVDNLRYKHKVAPIHTEISTKIENARMKISESTGNLPTIANESGNNDRRRSVRDIIESINKSQSMLKVNHDQSTNGLHETQSTDSMARNIRELNEREREIQNLLQDIDTRYGTHSAEGDSTLSEVATASELPMLSDGRGSYYDNLTDDNLNDNLDDKNNAASGFRVKKSPTKTVLIAEGGDDQQFQDCINWNPLPKPRRSHILTENGADSQQEATISNAPS
ncbi:uncharacterized protein LOC1279480 [Anopheles gambiae]|uniref:Uncharacterized protein n=1 Tax=Anopheles coluzzii TaxID=1518534 RepID=A0A6E8VZF7_ANOCL|nr:uncharacterized protein LOC120955481 [Anopheles coluzzii]XP_040232315.2 uncharacterized protein LOC120955481 [Anopheles coluzzii]XP_061510927.1 uncharacterized protein LOC1279480 [Anopheles gambiae]XP_061510928.1 uncharacterized protein LOC1279480 [Anopheles gambiae]XP_061510929.1 uncharacterized protein LOC1279480 [Anopheles gambiae]XP_061510930.1 uncharacterized protein LOC1279480 [Anopheles gambiae]XP_061510931.1 uncharacterized protein LOC1279480 [Anopheles gambiae]XP_061510932.1 unch